MIALDWFYSTIIHTLSFGDAFQMAPDGELICPNAEPISEDIKYRLFNLDISGADVHLCECDGSITRLQSAGFDLETCTLHCEEETLGLSWQLQSLTVTCLLPDPQEPTLQQQVALVDFSHLQGNMVLREPLDCVAERQLSFLQGADQRTQRLWFLWQEDSDNVACGCCGGCLFLDKSITRKPAIHTRGQSAVYSSQFFPLTSIPRHLALQGINQALATSSIYAVECIQSLHRGLCQHYHARYQERTVPVYTSSPATLSQPTVQDERSSKVGSFYSDEVYMSARSSLTSLLAEEYKSINDVNLEAVEEALTRKTRHKRKPSNLSVDFRAGGSGVGMDQEDGDQPLLSDSQCLNTSHFLHTVTLKIPYTVSPPPIDDTDAQTPTAPSTHYKVHHRQSASDTSFLMRAPSPEAPCLSVTPFHLYIPCLAQESAGKIPIITQKPTTHTLERRRRVTVKQNTSNGDNEAQQAKIALSVQVSRPSTVLLSPPALNIITRLACVGALK